MAIVARFISAGFDGGLNEKAGIGESRANGSRGEEKTRDLDASN